MMPSRTDGEFEICCQRRQTTDGGKNANRRWQFVRNAARPRDITYCLRVFEVRVGMATAAVVVAFPLFCVKDGR